MPIGCGLLSEEGAECTNKIFRFNRLHHARQTTIMENLKDVFCYSWQISNPLIQNILNKSRDRAKQRQALTPECLAALAKPEEPLQPPPPEMMDCDDC